jgi:hypothetical protein
MGCHSLGAKGRLGRSLQLQRYSRVRHAPPMKSDAHHRNDAGLADVENPSGVKTW